MACLKRASRSALVAFSPDAPFLAAGTMAGAVDLSFNSSANLEIFKLDFQSNDPELPVVGKCPSTERFNRLSWSKAGSAAAEEYSMGLIAGGLVDGSIDIWNPTKLIRSNETDGALVGHLLKHAGPVRGLDFNINSPNLLASGAEEGELCIWDLSNPAEPTRFPPLKSQGTGSQGEVSFLSWNHKVQHILASTSFNGVTMVWDLKRQKPVISFSEPKTKRCSVLQWHPDVATQVIVASDDDSSPSLRLWDVRNTISPTKEFVGHTKGVIAMSWCRSDTSFLLTCAKDNRTICWDTLTGEIVCELPSSSSWNFDIHWYPRIPGVITTSSFDGIGIYNIEACSRASLYEGDFSSTLSTVRLRAPKWLKCPTGASFGFGGKLISFCPISASSTGSEIYVHDLVTELSTMKHPTEFEEAIQNGERASLRSLCDKKAQASEFEDDKETWGFLKVMFEDEGTARTKLLVHLGFGVLTEGNEKLGVDLAKEVNNVSLDEAPSKPVLAVQSEPNEFPTDNGEDFFNNLQTPKGDESHPPANDVFEEADLPDGGEHESETLPEISDSSFDTDIQRALIVGDYEGAVLQCISANRMTDALVIAHVGGNALFQRFLDQYLKKSHLPYLKVVSAIAHNDLISLVKTRPLNNWKETLAFLCTFAEKEEWSVLCDTLASRLMVYGNTLAATLCYICAGNIDKTVEIWSRNLKAEQGRKSYVDLFEGLMEKTVVLALATGQKQFSTTLIKLVENYAELLASQGHLTTAMEYLKLLDSEGSSHELAILKDRIAFASRDREEPKALRQESSQLQTESTYGADASSLGMVDGSQHYYQDKFPPERHPSASTNFYREPYQQVSTTTYTGGSGGYPSIPLNQQFQEYVTPTPYQPSSYPNMFVPQLSQVSQPNFPPPPVTNQPPVKSFVPSTPPTLKNVEQYHQPTTLGSQLYPGLSNPAYQAGQPGPASVGPVPSQGGLVSGPKLSHVGAPTSTFMPSAGPGFAQTPSMPPMQPPSPQQPAQPQPVVSPPAPPPTVQTVDTSNVSAELRPVITTLTRLYNETSEALGGSRANPSKKREIEDNSRKIGSLFAKLNGGDISPNAASKLCQLCQALDNGDFANALHIQVVLTTSDWDECNFWLAALKRMIKTRQNVR